MGGGKPDVAIVADTGGEPDTVYPHLEWLQTQLSFPVFMVPCRYSLNGSGDHPPQIQLVARQCRSIHRGICRRGDLDEMPARPVVAQWLGISQEELTRRAARRVSWLTPTWPLIEVRRPAPPVRPGMGAPAPSGIGDRGGGIY